MSYVPEPYNPPQPIGAHADTAPGYQLSVYCGINRNGDQYGSAELVFDPGTDMSNISISSPDGALNCTPDALDPLRLYCTGPALRVGEPVTITACFINPPFSYQPVVDPTCPARYVLNPVSGLCEYMGQAGPLMCMPPTIPVPGYGCMDAPVSGQCPAGYYPAEFEGQPVCVPVGGPPCAGADCPAVCPPGLTFNPDLFCCDYPSNQIPVCPAGYVYDAGANTCIGNIPVEPGCTSITLTVPTCAPDQPDEPDQPDQPGPTGCWIVFNFGAGQVTQCVAPCPAGVPNQGPCTP